MEQLLLGIIMPPLVDIATKDVKADRPRFIIAVAVSLVAGAGSVLFSSPHAITPVSILTSIAGVFTASQVVFNLYWKESFLRDKWFSGSSSVTPSSTEEGQTQAAPVDQSANPLSYFGIGTPAPETHPEQEVQQ